MIIQDHILTRIQKYFQNISFDSHKNILGDKCYNYIPTESIFLYEILNIIKTKEKDIKNKKFLDIGSGIGNMCFIATLMGLNSEGIELNPVLYGVSKQIYPEIMFHNINILDFDNYCDYDIIFYCVPFSDVELQKQLKEKIENNIKIGSYIITRGIEEKDARFIHIDTDKHKKHIWIKTKQYL